MFEALSFQFIQNAIIAGFLISIITGIIGSLIVINRMVFLTGGIAHSAYGGIGLATFFNFPIIIGTTIFTIFSSLLISLISFNNKDRIDSFIGLIWAFGMALGIVLIDLTPGYNFNLIGYLFGSILSISYEDIYVILLFSIIIITSILYFYRKILLVSYDMEYALVKGINTKFIYSLILVLSALAIVISIKAVGLILILSLLTIPVYIAEKLSKSLHTMMIISIIFSFIFICLGLIFSYTFDISSGASIVFVGIIFFILFLLYDLF